MAFERNPDRPRIDARDKVLGKALFAADREVTGLLHAMTVPAAIAKGEIEAIDVAAAVRVPGVVRVFTWRDFADIRETPATRGRRRGSRLPADEAPVGTTSRRTRRAGGWRYLGGGDRRR